MVRRRSGKKHIARNTVTRHGLHHQNGLGMIAMRAIEVKMREGVVERSDIEITTTNTGIGIMINSHLIIMMNSRLIRGSQVRDIEHERVGYETRAVRIFVTVSQCSSSMACRSILEFLVHE